MTASRVGVGAIVADVVVGGVGVGVSGEEGSIVADDAGGTPPAGGTVSTMDVVGDP